MNSSAFTFSLISTAVRAIVCCHTTDDVMLVNIVLFVLCRCFLFSLSLLSFFKIITISMICSGSSSIKCCCYIICIDVDVFECIVCMSAPIHCVCK